MFDVDVTTGAVLFLTNILHLKRFEKCSSPKIAKKKLFCYSEKISQFFTSEKNKIYFYCRKIPILFILMCIEFISKYKIKIVYFLFHQDKR